MKKVFTDPLKRMVETSFPSRRIISLVPSLTELLFDLGLKEQVVGVTRFCIHPEKEWSAIPKVGGTKDFDPVIVEMLRPDLIIASKEENTRELIEIIAQKFPVYVSDITDLKEALDTIRIIGEMTGAWQKAVTLASQIEQRFAELSVASGLSVAYAIWRKPYMSAGGDTFIHQMLSYCGLNNVFKDKERYPVFTAEDLQALAPQLVFLSSEPYPFKEKHIVEFQQMLPSSRIVLVDGEYFSWYGSRLIHAPEYFKRLMEQING